MSEGSPSFPMARVLFIGSVFIGLAMAGLLIAYALLAKPLGLGQVSS